MVFTIVFKDGKTHRQEFSSSREFENTIRANKLFCTFKCHDSNPLNIDDVDFIRSDEAVGEMTPNDYSELSSLQNLGSFSREQAYLLHNLLNKERGIGEESVKIYFEKAETPVYFYDVGNTRSTSLGD